ncbi:DNA polymerase II large subunit [Candidatus Woesearchaeota archaeon]|nr:DNA polymerase II large subunit [Candidatus Woesearchaeota archaeon]
MQSELSKDMENYFKEINSNVSGAYDIANKARKKGYDPEDTVAIPLAKNMAERVEGLISAIMPQIMNAGIPKRIHELEEEYGKLDWRVALKVSLETAQEKFCKFENKIQAMETGIRVGLAYLTLGVVASPLEGFVGLKIGKRKDGKDYFSLMYSGPIRSAGGTGASVSVLVADYIRISFGYDKYDPTEKEIKRTVTELYDYHDRVTNLQYLPSEKEIIFLAKNVPVQIDGDPSEKIEVSNYKDLDRIKTNRIRSGPCLVMGECLAQKAPKLWATLSKWHSDFNLSDWTFLKEFLDLQGKVKSKIGREETKQKIAPVYTYIADLVAGRPVLTHPLRMGGFRLRYGRSRTSGYSSAAIHPATMHSLSRYLAIGTQLKVERPGKATAITSCDTIEGPIVKLKNGNVLILDTTQKAKEHCKEISEILFLGDILFNFGDFYNRAHTLLPPGYCEEWWALEVEKAIVNMFGALDLDKLAELTTIPLSRLNDILKNPLTDKLTAVEAVTLSKKLNTPLHPKFTYHWKAISLEQLISLVNWLDSAKITTGYNKVEKIILPFKEEKRILELIGLPHINTNNEYVVIWKDDALAFSTALDLQNKKIEEIKKIIEESKDMDILAVMNLISEVRLRDKSGVFIGARMGRPEKAKMRKLTGSPHTLFPVGDEGGKLRNFQSALEAGRITAEFPVYYCGKCDKETIFSICETCNKKTKRKYFCTYCGMLDDKCKKKDSQGMIHKSELYRLKYIDLNNIFGKSLKKINMNSYPDLIKGVRGTSNQDHTPEHLIKGILRAKHDVYVNKDGTTRYDMTQLPITHFKPKEIMTSIEKLKELGYSRDITGKELTDPNQTLELKPQDVILPSCQESPDSPADKALFNTTSFIDDLLINFYKQEPFYKLESGMDLAGHLVIALAPHTSAAIVCRIIGFSRTLGFFAHPMLHAATRRDCDGDEASIILLMDALLNFSRKFLPNSRGATQDAPLVLTSNLVPSEVDDMVFDMDITYKYPLEFYEACLDFKHPSSIDMDQLGKKLNTPEQYEKMGFTHQTSNINSGVRCSAYKTLPSMKDKLMGQMHLADIIRAVDEVDVARLVIEKHFLRDIKGNLRKFSIQQFRCVKCNEKYRRPPLIGNCIKCNGRIIFTISEGSIVKYLEPAISLAEKYDLPAYLKQTLELTKLRIESVFGKDKEKQEALGKWFKTE